MDYRNKSLPVDLAIHLLKTQAKQATRVRGISELGVNRVSLDIEARPETLARQRVRVHRDDVLKAGCFRAFGAELKRVRLDRKATSISRLVVLGVHEDGQKVLLAIKSMGGESSEAWRTVLDDLINRGLRRPEFLIVYGALGLDKAIAGMWDGVPVQRCIVHKHRNLLAHAPDRLQRPKTPFEP
jgi:Transposase, Mutator family